MEIKTNAPVITRDEILISAPIQTIWDIQTNVNWGGPAQGIVAVHVWTLQERQSGVLVHTEESWEGEPVNAQTEALQAALDGSLRGWLENLKREAQRT